MTLKLKDKTGRNLFVILMLLFSMGSFSTPTITEAAQTLTISIENNNRSLNGFIHIQGTMTDHPGGSETLVLTVNNLDGSQNWKSGDIPITIDLNGNWQYSLDVTNYLDGEYTLVATINLIDSNSAPFTVDHTKPIVTITKPTKSFVNEAIVDGAINEEISSGTLRLFDSVGVEVFSSAVTTSNFSIDLLINEGTYTYSVNATDLSGNAAVEVTGSFTYDKTRPYISPASLTPQHNIAQVTLDSIVVSAQIIDNYELLSTNLPNDTIKVFEKGSDIPIAGTIQYQNGILSFIPDQLYTWKHNQKYYVVISPLITDQAGNPIHPRSWSFTTETTTQVESPHGNYLDNTNTCKTCHNVHTAPKPRLEGENLEVLNDPAGELTNKTIHDGVNGYCMACHDGTVASPMLDHMSSTSNHNKTLKLKDRGVVSQSCGNCHDVHLASHPNNPNMLEDHFTYTHLNAEIGFIDSSEQLCEACHESDSLSVKLDERVLYEVFPYRNWHTSMEAGGSFGSSGDYQLCLRCHNNEYSQQYENVIDIESYYNNINSGHFISREAGKEHLPDGSFLNGHIPCTDCHASHSSTNVKLLNETLGHNHPATFQQTSLLEDGTWPEDRERAYCLTCHNNSTELYGITAPLKETNEAGEVILGHEAGSTQSCATCHGGTTQSFLEAVHAPTKIN